MTLDGDDHSRFRVSELRASSPAEFPVPRSAFASKSHRNRMEIGRDNLSPGIKTVRHVRAISRNRKRLPSSARRKHDVGRGRRGRRATSRARIHLADVVLAAINLLRNLGLARFSTTFRSEISPVRLPDNERAHVPRRLNISNPEEGCRDAEENGERTPSFVDLNGGSWCRRRRETIFLPRFSRFDGFLIDAILETSTAPRRAFLEIVSFKLAGETSGKLGYPFA